MSGILFDKAVPTTDEGSETEWVIVGYDPSSFRYSDEDSKAMDRTNFEALVSGFDSENEWAPDFGPWHKSKSQQNEELRNYGSSSNSRTLLNPSEGTYWIGRADEFPFESDYYSSSVPFSWQTIVVALRKPGFSVAHWSDDCTDSGCTLSEEHSKLVHPEDSGSVVWLEVPREWEHYEECLRSLSDYPLLDESSYSALEYEAWERCVSDYVIRDTARSVWNLLSPFTQAWLLVILADTSGPEDWIEDNSEEWISEALSNCSYFYGFSGDYDSKSVEEVCAEWVTVRVWAMFFEAESLATERSGVSFEQAIYAVRSWPTRWLGLEDFRSGASSTSRFRPFSKHYGREVGW